MNTAKTSNFGRLNLFWDLFYTDARSEPKNIKEKWLLFTHSSTVFLEHMLARFQFPVECVQTDNGFEFTKRFLNTNNDNLTMFEKKLSEPGIRHKKIRPFTPRHNGKVERSHRKDNEYFYAVKKLYSFNDFKHQLYIHNWKYNRFPMRPLGWKSLKQTLIDFLQDGVTYV
ncbi:MAG: hypothetical protein PHE79_11210 [Eubacteriales bacterium]|nr:hypothetical protein [Eubacteriales bacterium]